MGAFGKAFIGSGHGGDMGCADDKGGAFQKMRKLNVPLCRFGGVFLKIMQDQLRLGAEQRQELTLQICIALGLIDQMIEIEGGNVHIIRVRGLKHESRMPHRFVFGHLRGTYLTGMSLYGNGSVNDVSKETRRPVLFTFHWL